MIYEWKRFKIARILTERHKPQICRSLQHIFILNLLYFNYDIFIEIMDVLNYIIMRSLPKFGNAKKERINKS